MFVFYTGLHVDKVELQTENVKPQTPNPNLNFQTLNRKPQTANRKNLRRKHSNCAPPPNFPPGALPWRTRIQAVLVRTPDLLPRCATPTSCLTTEP